MSESLQIVTPPSAPEDFIQFCRPKASRLIAVCCYVTSMVYISNISTCKSSYYAHFHSVIKYVIIFVVIHTTVGRSELRLVHKIEILVEVRLIRDSACWMQIHIFLSLRRAFWYSHSSFTNRCTFVKTLIKIYIKFRWLLHVSVYDHHQGACNWAWLKLYWY